MRTLALALALASATAASTMAGGALSGRVARSTGRWLAPGRAAARSALSPAALRFGVSLGSPTEGRLLGGTHLDETTYLRVMPDDAAGDVRWGLGSLVDMIDRAARTVRRQFPGTITSVGHLSREGGGDIDRHRSHESGRDADIGFFVRSLAGKQLLPAHFVPFRADGTASSWPGAYFDDARNWALVAALASDPEARVTHVFVASPLRARLLAYAERQGIDASLRARAAELMQQPHGALPHDDHFHVRIGCPARMNGCVENPAPPRSAKTRRVEHRGPVVELRSAKHAPRAPTTDSPELRRTSPETPATPRVSEPDSPPAAIDLPIDDVDG